jgi:hypothetical protein
MLIIRPLSAFKGTEGNEKKKNIGFIKFLFLSFTIASASGTMSFFLNFFFLMLSVVCALQARVQKNNSE